MALHPDPPLPSAMSESPSIDASPQRRDPADRLDSWKEIAAHLKRDVTTVQRWEKREAMPVHRHLHDKLGSVYAFRSELDAWTRSRTTEQPAELRQDAGLLQDLSPDSVATLGGADPANDNSQSVAESSPDSPAQARPSRRGVRSALLAAVVATLVAVAVFAWRAPRPPAAKAQPLAGARFSQLSDFGGTEQAAAISRDGRFVAFLSDQDGPTDVWVTQVRTGRFYNLTRGAVTDLAANPSVRTVGFSPDGSLVTFWTRRVDAAGQAHTSIWAAPILGGPARPYLGPGLTSKARPNSTGRRTVLVSCITRAPPAIRCS
jgi:hypothetical protein